MKKAVIKKVDDSGDWKHPVSQKIIYYHKLTLDNGEEGIYGSQKKFPDIITTGNTIEYEISDGKIKIINFWHPVTQKEEEKPQEKNEAPKAQKTESRNPAEYLGYSFGYAKDLIIAGKTMECVPEMIKMGKYMFNRVKELLKDPNSPVSSEKTPTAVVEPKKVETRGRKKIEKKPEIKEEKKPVKKRGRPSKNSNSEPKEKPKKAEKKAKPTPLQLSIPD